MLIQQMLHGYADGHRLLACSFSPSVESFNKVAELSDWNEFSTKGDDEHSYITAYPLGDGEYYVIARTWYANEMKRPGCVWTHSLFIKYEDLLAGFDVRRTLEMFLRPEESQYSYYSNPIACEINSNKPKKLDTDISLICVLVADLLQFKTPIIIDPIKSALWMQELCLTLIHLMPVGYLLKLSFCSSTANLVQYRNDFLSMQFTTKAFAEYNSSYQKSDIEEVVTYVTDFFIGRELYFQFVKVFSGDIMYNYSKFTAVVRLCRSIRRTKTDDYDSMFALLKQVEELAPNANDLSLLKERLIRECSSGGERFVLRSIMYLKTDNVFELEKAKYQQRLEQYYSNDKRACAEEVYHIINNRDYNDLAPRFIKQTTEWMVEEDWQHLYEMLGKSEFNISEDLLILMASCGVDIMGAMMKYYNEVKVTSDMPYSYLIHQYYNCDMMVNWLDRQEGINNDAIYSLVADIIPAKGELTNTFNAQTAKCLCNSKITSTGYFIYLFCLSAKTSNAEAESILLAKSFVQIHKKQKRSELTWTEWSQIEKYLPSLSFFQMWDRCKALRNYLFQRMDALKLDESFLDKLSSNWKFTNYIHKQYQEYHS